MCHLLSATFPDIAFTRKIRKSDSFLGWQMCQHRCHGEHNVASNGAKDFVWVKPQLKYSFAKWSKFIIVYKEQKTLAHIRLFDQNRANWFRWLHINKQINLGRWPFSSMNWGGFQSNPSPTTLSHVGAPRKCALHAVVGRSGDLQEVRENIFPYLCVGTLMGPPLLPLTHPPIPPLKCPFTPPPCPETTLATNISLPTVAGCPCGMCQPLIHHFDRKLNPLVEGICGIGLLDGFHMGGLYSEQKVT